MYEYILKQLTEEQLKKYVELARKLGMDESVINEGLHIIRKEQHNERKRNECK